MVSRDATPSLGGAPNYEVFVVLLVIRLILHIPLLRRGHLVCCR